LVEVQALDIQRLHLKFRGGWLDWDLPTLAGVAARLRRARWSDNRGTAGNSGRQREGIFCTV